MIAGRRVRRAHGNGSLLVLPMSYEGELVGALAVMSPHDEAGLDGDVEAVLAILANNAAIAMENARLFELEKETVRRLRELDAMKTDFLSTVQHELRTPLTAIMGLSDLMEMCWEIWEDAPKLDALRDIQVAANNLDGIVETLIDFSVGDGEALVLALTDVPLEDAVRSAIGVVGERHKGGLPVPAEVEVDTGITVLADPDRLGQVLRALIDNAVKFSDGHGSVLVRGTRDGSGNVLVEVIDEGIGIPAEDVPRIFERFFQVNNTATRRFGGTGMGLALVKRVAEAHGATIDVETRVGSGTRISLRWPQRAAASAELRDHEYRRRPPRQGYNDRGRARRGVSGALYPQSAIAGLNSPPRGRVIGSAPDAPALTTGSRAARAREPRQVRKEAAVSGSPGVPWGNLV